MPERPEKGQQVAPMLGQFRRNMLSCMHLCRATGAKETLRAAAAALKRHDFVASVKTYLLENTSLVCVSDQGLANDLSILNQEHPAVLSLFKRHITISRPDGCVEIAAAIGGAPAPTGVIHVVLSRGGTDARLLVRHLFQAASDRLCIPETKAAPEVTDDSPQAVSRLSVREDLFNGIIHEIKNPLAAVMAHLDVLRLDRGGDPVVASHLDVLIPQVARLSAILDRAWTFARASRETAPLSVGESLRGIVELVSHHYRTNNVEFELHIPEDLPHVAGIAWRLQQVWLNCFNNALHALGAAGRAGGKIRVNARHDGALRRVSVEIADSGVGMDGKTLRLVRDLSLGRGDSTGTFGMGIRESARIVAEHGGRFEICSEQGIGTTVRVFLPCANVQDQHPLEKEES